MQPLFSFECIDANFSSSSTITTIMSSPSMKSKDGTGPKKVSFAASVRAKKTLSRSRYSAQEKEATWYDMGDLEDIGEEIHFQVQRLDNGEIPCCEDGDLRGEQSFCVRGLENQTQEGKLRLDKMRRTAREVVFQLQDSREGSDKISIVYAENSKLCRYNAHVVGVTDAQVAHKIYRQRPDPKKKLQKNDEFDVEREAFCALRASKLLERRRHNMTKIVGAAA